MYKVNVDNELYSFYKILIIPTHETRRNPVTNIPEAVEAGCRVVGSAFGGTSKYLSGIISRKEAEEMTTTIFNSRKRKFTIKEGKLCP